VQGATGTQGPTGPQGPTGSLGATGPSGPSGTTGQSITTVFGTGTLTVTPSSASALIPGLTQTLTVPSNSVLYISTDGGVQTGSGLNDFSVVDISVFIDNSAIIEGGSRRLDPVNTVALTSVIQDWSLSASATLTPGSHTIEIHAAGANLGGSNASVSSDGTNTAPNNKVRQGQLTILLLKQ